MDPTKTIDQLGSGSAQVILAVIVVGLALALWYAVRALLKSYDDRLAETRETLKQSSADTRLVTEALRDMKNTIDLALAALRVRS